MKNNLKKILANTGDTFGARAFTTSAGSRVKLVEHILTDGSRVYDIEIEQVTINALDGRDAERRLELLEKALT